MKGRPKTVRKISFMPAVSGFKPYGDHLDKSRKACVFLYYEEYEALRLNDYEKHSQCESAEIMQISRPTFTRIYMSAREKIAKAFVEGLRIVVEGGKVELDGNWYVCHQCKAIFSNEDGDVKTCALCGSSDIAPYSIMEKEQPEATSGTLTSKLSPKQPLPDAGDLSLPNRRRACGRRRCQHKADADGLEKDLDE